MKLNENEMNFSVPLEIIKASEIEPKEVKWLWYPYIPFGKVTLLQGDPGDGKSKLMLSIAALLSKGEPIPFTETEENEPMTIIYQTTEDDADDIVWEGKPMRTTIFWSMTGTCLENRPTLMVSMGLLLIIRPTR